MKNILTILLLILLQNVGLTQHKPLLEDFTVEEIYVEKRKSSYYLLHLKDSLNISIKTYSRPVKILDSYFDTTYLVIVFQNENGHHHLTGVYKDKNTKTWVPDYFYKYLDDIVSSFYSAFVSDVKFLDGETVLLTYNVNEMRKGKSKMTQILRIGKNKIWTYKKKEESSLIGRKGNNPIRPVE